jgi:hypothetical protein
VLIELTALINGEQTGVADTIDMIDFINDESQRKQLMQSLELVLLSAVRRHVMRLDTGYSQRTEIISHPAV